MIIGQAGRLRSPPFRALSWIDRISFDDRVQRRGHQLMHRFGLVSFDEIWFPAVPGKELGQFLVVHAGQHGGIRDLVAVQMKDRQHRAVARRIQKLVAMPTRGQRSGFGLAVSDDATGEQVRIVEDRAAGVHDRVAEFSAFVDRARSFGRGVAGNSAGKRKLFEQFLHALFVLRDVGVELGVRAFEIGIRDHARAAVAGASEVDHIQIVLLDQAVEMRVDEVQSRRGSQVSQQPRLDMLELERLAQQRIGVQINLSDRKVIGGAPVGVDLAHLFGAKRLGFVGLGSIPRLGEVTAAGGVIDPAFLLRLGYILNSREFLG